MSTQIIVHDSDGRRHVHDADHWNIHEGRLAIRRRNVPMLVAEYTEWSSVHLKEDTVPHPSDGEQLASKVLKHLTAHRKYGFEEPSKIILNPTDWRHLFGTSPQGMIWGKDAAPSELVPAGSVAVVA